MIFSCRGEDGRATWSIMAVEAPEPSSCAAMLARSVLLTCAC